MSLTMDCGEVLSSSGGLNDGPAIGEHRPDDVDRAA